MSLETWKAEFYPISAKEAAKGAELEAVEHSIRKWEGLTKENLERHGVETFIGGFSLRSLLEGVERFEIDQNSCALCLRHEDCKTCSIFEYSSTECSDDDSAFGQWSGHTDPHPMLRVLNQTREWLISRAPVAPDAPKSTGPMETPTEATAAPQEAK